MKFSFILLLFFVTASSFGQSLESGNLWRTKGVHDSLGNFIDRAKIQSFLFISSTNVILRLNTQDKMNMETGETKVFVNQDTLKLKPISSSTFQAGDKETITIHSADSLTIKYNNYHISYVKLSIPKKELNINRLKKGLIGKTMNQTIEGETKFSYTFKENGLAKISPVDSKSGWESEYKLIDFNGYIILQGIVSAPKLFVSISKEELQFIEIDYRFDNKNGKLIPIY